MDLEPLILAANPGSASRKYAIYRGPKCLGSFHFEQAGERINCTARMPGSVETTQHDISQLDGCLEVFLSLIRQKHLIANGSQFDIIGLRIVAPGSYFLSDRLIDDDYIARLRSAQSVAPLHIEMMLAEYDRLHAAFQGCPVIAVSDSAFHANKPAVAWNYGIALADADRYDIKRFGYHGLAVESAVDQLKSNDSLKAKTVVCHLGGGCSVTAVNNGQSQDNTMGYTPLDGLIMATRSGQIDPLVLNSLKLAKQFDDEALSHYLFNECGLAGLSGNSGDVRTLLELEANGDPNASLALDTFVYRIQQSIGQMAATLGGIDSLVFSGTIGVRSAVIRSRIIQKLSFLGIALSPENNNMVTSIPDLPILISHQDQASEVWVVPVNEASIIARHAHGQSARHSSL